MKVNIEKEVPAKGSSLQARWIIKDQRGNGLGLIEKFKNRPGETHPWKAYKGRFPILPGNHEFKVFYKEDGGYEAAVKFICA